MKNKRNGKKTWLEWTNLVFSFPFTLLTLFANSLLTAVASSSFAAEQKNLKRVPIPTINEAGLPSLSVSHFSSLIFALFSNPRFLMVLRILSLSFLANENTEKWVVEGPAVVVYCMYLQQLIGPKRKDKVRLVAECSVCCDSGISSLSGCKKGDSFVSSPPGEKDEIKSLACIFFLFRHEKESRLPYFQYGVMGCPGFRPLRWGIKSGCGGKGKNLFFLLPLVSWERGRESTANGYIMYTAV